MTKTITGPQKLIRPIALEMLLLGSPVGMRQLDDDLYSLELPADDWLAIEKVHVSWFINARNNTVTGGLAI
jgi:hypothetical protein